MKRQIVDLGNLDIDAIDFLMERYSHEVETPDEEEFEEVEDDGVCNEEGLSATEKKAFNGRLEGPFLVRTGEE